MAITRLNKMEITKKSSIDSIGKHSMVSTPHPLATSAALAVLREGGNAVDAAIAANTTLSVLLPDQCGLGGDLFAIIYDPKDNQLPVHVLNASGFAPARASISEFQRMGHRSMPQQGPLSVTVPGTVQGWGQLSQRWGKLPWSDLFQNAYKLASEGFLVNAPFSQSIQSYAAKLISSGAAELYTPGGFPLKSGDRLVQDRLADTIRMIMINGWECFYSGDISKAISQTVLSEGGLLEIGDLQGYSVEWANPISTVYRDYQIYTTPPNTRGAILLAVLDQLAKVDLKMMRYQSVEFITLMVNLFRQVTASLEECLGDPHFVECPTSVWGAHAISRDTADNHLPPINLKGDTIALCVVDQDGMGVSLIQSVYHDFGSGVYVEPLGIFLQNRGASFCFEPDHPNSLAPKKRPLHTLMPSLVMKDGKLSMALGTRGGAGQPQTLAQILTAVIDYGFSAQEALELPRWIYGSTTSARQTNGLILESSLGQEVSDCLSEGGLPVQVTDPFSVSWMGCAQLIIIDQKDKRLYGGADPRGGGLADGY